MSRLPGMPPRKPAKPPDPDPPKKPKPEVKKPAARKKAAGSAASASSAASRQKQTSSMRRCTPKEQRFVDEYLIDLNGTQAAIRAGYSASSARQIASENLSKPYIQHAIAEARRAQQQRTRITADRVVQEIANVALADARELVEVRTGCCRCCYGEGHKYQRTVGEMNRDREDWVEKGGNPAEFDEAGGIGFNPLLLPKEGCPICGGDGMARTVLKDTRTLSPQAAALYAGAKQTKEGIEIKMHSKVEALEKLAKHLGLYAEDNRQRTDPLASLLHSIASGNSNGFRPVQRDPEHESDEP
ncbi:hypothetical protein ABIC63_000519 [Pseudacidovorax sp. 1753]|uniref:terminase small subunit n=1 Tax=Pseudacidovorax sp. 1753 TaxID=3156419 RepID=UPI00339645D1